MTSVNAGDTKTNNEKTRTAIIDTGSTLIAGPKAEVAAFWAACVLSLLPSLFDFY
jgi:hypothetical protein